MASSMILDPAGREYATWTITTSSAPTGVDVSVDGGVTWTALTQVGTSSQWQVLVAGPSAAGNPTGTLVLPSGRSVTKVRIAATPESIIRDTSPIDVQS